jgi:16S rRNA (cytosine967-C5)-methyltransferase
MDKVPEFAAVNEAVKLVKIKEEKAAPLVNGILRNILRNKGEFDNIGIKNKTKRLSIKYSHPEWFIRKFQALYGEDFVVELMKINFLKINREELIEEFETEGFEVIEGGMEESIILKGYSKIESSKQFNKGYFIFQDESSMLVARALDPKPEDRIIDLCSAPGGKTAHIASLMQNKGEILAFDIYRHKLELIDENAKKLGINIIKTSLGDATIYNEALFELGDRVLVDAPCSGLGLIRKKPEIRWNVTEADILELKKLQNMILNNASKYLKKGGILIYSTCTISEEENEEQIMEFLVGNPNFKLENISEYLPDKYKAEVSTEGFIKLFPNVHNCDGFFIARLRKEW